MFRVEMASITFCCISCTPCQLISFPDIFLMAETIGCSVCCINNCTIHCVSIYIDNKYQGSGIGTKLLKKLCNESEKRGYWCLYVAIFSINRPSIELHKKCGFREIGYRERIAKDRFGKWQNTVLMERRLPE